MAIKFGSKERKELTKPKLEITKEEALLLLSDRDWETNFIAIM